MKNNNRSFYILKYLFDNTDKSHTATITDINSYLYNFDLDADRKTIADCINQLIEIGYDIKCIRKSQNHYYMDSRSFSLPEIRLLIDAVQSSRFISEDDSFALVNKLTKLVGEHGSDTLKQHLYIESRPKSENADITGMIQIISGAIDTCSKIVFQYFEYDPEKKKVLKHNGREYIISPHAMVWNTDQYYLVGYNDDRHKECKYRLDRMCSVKKLNDIAISIDNNFNISELFNSEFSMMSGEMCEVHLLCDNILMDSIVDKFGLDVQTKVIDDEHFEVIAPVKLSGTFFGWVFASKGKMKITSPQEAVNRFNEIAKEYILN